MPKVLLDLRMAHGRPHGIARYALELARRLPLLRADWSFVGLIGPGPFSPPRELFPDIPLDLCPGGFLSVWEQPLLAMELNGLRPDLFHATSFSVPRFWNGPLVTTLHDANHLAFPKDFGRATSIYYRWVVRPRLRKARRVLTVSEFSKGELVKHLGLDPAQVAVISEAADERFVRRGEEEVRSFRSKYGLPDRYFAVVGNEKVHKNLRLLSSVEADLPCPIALLAGEGARAGQGFSQRTHELPQLSEEELACFYSGADALLLPSSYEGFGLPAVEAMACGCPVLAADAGALPEVTAGAALLLAPNDPTVWAEAAKKVHFEAAFARELSEKGKARAEQLSWDACARATLAEYERALS